MKKKLIDTMEFIPSRLPRNVCWWVFTVNWTESRATCGRPLSIPVRVRKHPDKGQSQGMPVVNYIGQVY